jgi:hypothetical protein
VNTTFAVGSSFSSWLKGVGALTAAGPPPAIELENVASSVSTVGQSTDQLIYDPSTSPGETKALIFETPVGSLPLPAAFTYCGGVAFTDVHTIVGSTDGVTAIPSGCTPVPWPPELAVEEFLFFHVSGWAQQPRGPVKTGPPH